MNNQTLQVIELFSQMMALGLLMTTPRLMLQTQKLTCTDEMIEDNIDELADTMEEYAHSPNARVQRAVELIGDVIGIECEGSIVICRDKHGKIVGFATYSTGYDYWTRRNALLIHSLGALKPDIGIGRALLRELISRAKELNQDSVVVTPEEDAVGFYKRMGFTWRKFGDEKCMMYIVRRGKKL